jgi:hypothetical protein
MFFQLVESLASCLDRESARKVNSLCLDDVKILKRHIELLWKDDRGQLTAEEKTTLMMDVFATHFLVALQVKGRAILRRPIGAKSTRPGGQ